MTPADIDLVKRLLAQLHSSGYLTSALEIPTDTGPLKIELYQAPVSEHELSPMEKKNLKVGPTRSAMTERAMKALGLTGAE